LGFEYAAEDGQGNTFDRRRGGHIKDNSGFALGGILQIRVRLQKAFLFHDVILPECAVFIKGKEVAMKKHLNTLFVTTQGSYLAKEGETIVVKVEREVRLRLPVHTIGGIVCFGNVSCSPFLMGFCAENGVGVSFLSEHGRFLARIQGPVSGNVLLRREQYRRADDPKASTDVARPAQSRPRSDGGIPTVSGGPPRPLPD
jgi:hypothetical protein